MDVDQYSLAILAILSSILVISLVWYCKPLSKSEAKLPPGPRGVPVLGYLPFLSTNLAHQFGNLATKYGPIYKIRLGKKLCVVINSPSLVKELVRDQDGVFANRDATVAAYVLTYGAKDIAWSPYNSEWRAMRKIFVREMLSNRNLEASYSLRKDEVRKCIRQVYEDGKAVEISLLAFSTELKVVTNLLWGGMLEGEEGERVGKEFRAVFRRIIDLLIKPNISDFYPFLTGLDIQGIKKQMEDCRNYMGEILGAIILEHRKKLAISSLAEEGKKDFLQILLELQEKDTEYSMSDSQLKALLLDIVVGGTDTTATTIEWLMSELLGNPEAMEKVQKELSEVVGLNNTVEEHHIPKLKYLDAAVKEATRLHPAVPFLVPRSPSQSSVVGGYTIPTNTRVLINTPYIHKDPQFWDSPLEFKPERFLDNDQYDFSGNNFQFLPFGSGRRVCAGLPLAERMMMYLLASLLHSFDWKLPKDQKLDMSESVGIILRKTVPLVAIPTPRLSESKLYL